MGEFFFTFLIFFGAIAIAAVLFLGWVVALVVKGLLWAVGGATGTTHRRAMAQLRACDHVRCGQMNPVSAKFCRRCGRAIAHDVAIAPKRVAA